MDGFLLYSLKKHRFRGIHMKKCFKYISVALVALTLSSCDLFNKLLKEDYTSYEEYFEKELNYGKYTDMTSLNYTISQEAYFWSKNDATDYTAYYTGKSIMIMVYKNRDDVNLRFTDGNNVSVKKSDGVTTIKTTNSFNGYSVLYDAGTEQKTVVGSTTEDELNVAKDDGGYLIVAFQKYMFYVTNDLKNVYVNEKNTNEFQGYENTKTIPTSTLLTNTLLAFGVDQRLQLPAPSNEYEVWFGKSFYQDHISHTTAYLAGIKPEDYVKTLEDNGFTVIRSYEDPFYAFYGERGGFWYCYDEKQEIELIISLQFYLYTSNLGKTFGPYDNTCIWLYPMKRGYFGDKERTTETDWSDFDKQTMAGWYDGTIDATKVPFIQLGREYMIPSAGTMSYAHTGLLDGTLKLHSKCYNISDNSTVYYLDGYDEILEANGFHKFDPKCDLSNYDQKKAFQNTEDSKYYGCFINDKEDIAVKYYFDVDFGNTIRVFKKSEMQSWLQDEK